MREREKIRQNTGKKWINCYHHQYRSETTTKSNSSRNTIQRHLLRAEQRYVLKHWRNVLDEFLPFHSASFVHSKWQNLNRPMDILRHRVALRNVRKPKMHYHDRANCANKLNEKNSIMKQTTTIGNAVLQNETRKRFLLTPK